MRNVGRSARPVLCVHSLEVERICSLPLVLLKFKHILNRKYCRIMELLSQYIHPKHLTILRLVVRQRTILRFTLAACLDYFNLSVNQSYDRISIEIVSATSKIYNKVIKIVWSQCKYRSLAWWNWLEVIMTSNNLIIITIQWGSGIPQIDISHTGSLLPFWLGLVCEVVTDYQRKLILDYNWLNTFM